MLTRKEFSISFLQLSIFHFPDPLPPTVIILFAKKSKVNQIVSAKMADFKFPEKIFFDFRRPAYSREIERIEAEKGALRRKSTQNNDAAKSDVEIFPPQADQGATRDIVAKAVGFSVLAQF